MTNQVSVALCAGRHQIKTNEGVEVIDSIFNHIENPMDFDYMEGRASDFLHEIENNGVQILNLYITGLTPALTSFLALAKHAPTLKITLWHFNRLTGDYMPQYFQNWM